MSLPPPSRIKLFAESEQHSSAITVKTREILDPVLLRQLKGLHGLSGL